MQISELSPLGRAAPGCHLGPLEPVSDAGWQLRAPLLLAGSSHERAMQQHPSRCLPHGKGSSSAHGNSMLLYTCDVYRKSVYSFKVLLIAVKCNQSALNFIEQKLIWPSVARQSRTPKHPKKTIFFPVSWTLYQTIKLEAQCCNSDSGGTLFISCFNRTDSLSTIL